MDQYVSGLKAALHVLGVSHEVRRKVSFVELHSLNNVESGFDTLGFFNGDGSVFANLVHGLGDDVADLSIPVSGDCCDLGNFLGVGDFLGDFLELCNDGAGGLEDTALEADWVGTSSHVAKTFFVDGLGEDGCGGCSVTCNVRGLGRDFLDQLSTHVFIGAVELDFLGDRDTVFGHGWRTEFFVDDDIATGRSQSCLHGAGQFGYSTEEGLTCCFVELKLFSHNSFFF